ncbi:YeiH family protein [Bacillus sp. Marseille-P3661]|uniref:YeiH family protein n=1 Tax=Bacillus sp. Marseille-P3661 TaxID=1936234 RepID=UPI0015E17669|nr:YeiH family protein [Bacillus sp. Marseille-P3661]
MADIQSQHIKMVSRLGKVEVLKKLKFGKYLSGILLVFVLAYIAHTVGKELPLIGSTVMAILLGVLMRNFLTIPVIFDAGIQYSLKKVLKYAIVLLGSSLNLYQVLIIGGSSLIPIVITVILGILLTSFVGKRLGLSGNISPLIGVGTAICGATAIATISPIMKAKEEETAYAITTIFIFNVIAVIAYPLIGALVGMPNEIFGMWAGAAIHDTSSVVAAAFAYSNEAGEVATVVKLTRTLFLVPLAIIIGVWVSIKNNKDINEGSKIKLHKVFPMFLFGFLGMSLLNTVGFFSASTVEVITVISKFMILMAMVSVGLSADIKKIRHLGMAPIYTGLFASVLVAVVSIAIIYLTY